MKSLAMLDAIISPKWQSRYYSFNASWAPGEEMASMSDGGGDEWFVLFTPAGAALKGLAHELASDKTFPDRIQQRVPPEFHSFLNEPAFSMEHATFCFWRREAVLHWTVVQPAFALLSAETDGSHELLQILDQEPATYQAWSQDYYERDIPLAPIRAIYDHLPLSTELLATLNPDLQLADLATDAEAIGYPLSS